MANYDWYAERSDLSDIALLDRAPESDGIDLKAVRQYRLARVRAEMVRYSVYANRYYLSAHGCGMTGEYPYLYHHGDFPDAGYDGEIQPGMTICIESYIGREGGFEGVKLEQQVLVTKTGIELLSRYPFEQAFL